MALVDGLLQELDQEALPTQRVLERVPDNQLLWKPHPRSRTLGDLAMHVATTPGGVAQFAAQVSPVQPPQFSDVHPRTADELVPALEESIATAKKVLGQMSDADLLSTWRMVQGKRELLAMPRIAFLRSIMLNHWYHHRGQLTVYLRQLNVPLPAIYGPSADENPFA